MPTKPYRKDGLLAKARQVLKLIKDRERKARKIQSMSPAEKEVYLAKTRGYNQKHKERLTPDEKIKYIARQHGYNQKYHEKAVSKKKAEHLVKIQEQQNQCEPQETQEQCEQRKAWVTQLVEKGAHNLDVDLSTLTKQECDLWVKLKAQHIRQWLSKQAV